jgi:competence protein ComGC
MAYARRSFTLVEMMVIVVIIGILATLAVFGYAGAVEKAKLDSCETNLKALKSALDIYMMEHDAVPGSMAMLPDSYIERGFARVLSGPGGLRRRLANFILELDSRGNAYAYSYFVLNTLARGDRKMVVCPAQRSPAPWGSYGINSALLGMSAVDYRNLGPRVAVLGDSDSPDFISLSNSVSSPRHKHGSLFLCSVVVKSGEVHIEEGSNSISVYGLLPLW